MRFETPSAFLLLLLLPAWWFILKRAVPLPALRFSSATLVEGVGRSLRQRFLWIPSFLRFCSLVLLISALARPQQGVEQVREVSEGVAIMMVVDRSGSMGAEMNFDGRRMTRLDVVKKVFVCLLYTSPSPRDS